MKKLLILLLLPIWGFAQTTIPKPKNQSKKVILQDSSKHKMPISKVTSTDLMHTQIDSTKVVHSKMVIKKLN